MSESQDQAKPTGNVMRQEYRQLSDADKALMLDIKNFGQQFYDLCTNIGQSRELSLAKTKVEEAVMWAIKHVTA